MKKILMMLLGVAFAACAWADIVWDNGFGINAYNDPGDDGAPFVGDIYLMVGDSQAQGEFLSAIVAAGTGFVANFESQVASAISEMEHADFEPDTKKFSTTLTGSKSFFVVALDAANKGVYVSEVWDGRIRTSGDTTVSFNHDAAYKNEAFAPREEYQGPGWYTVGAIPLPDVTIINIAKNATTWTDVDISCVVSNATEGADCKFVFDVTASGETKSVTNDTVIVNGEYTKKINTVELFGDEVSDINAKVVVNILAGEDDLIKVGEAFVQLVQNDPAIFITTMEGSHTGELVAKADYTTPTQFKITLTQRPANNNDPIRISLNPQFLRTTTEGEFQEVELAEIHPYDGMYITVLADNTTTEPLAEYAAKEIDVPAGENEATFYVYMLGSPAAVEGNLPITHLRFEPSVDDPSVSVFYNTGKSKGLTCSISNIKPTITKFDLPTTAEQGAYVSIDCVVKDNIRDIGMHPEWGDYLNWEGYEFELKIGDETLYSENYVHFDLDNGEYKTTLYAMIPNQITNRVNGVFTLKDPSHKTDDDAAKKVFSAVPYRAWDGKKKIITNNICFNPESMTEETTELEDGKWYVVEEDIEINGTITVEGAAHIVLSDGATLKISAAAGEGKPAIDILENASLSIHGQIEGTGKLIAKGDDGVSAIMGDINCEAYQDRYTWTGKSEDNCAVKTVPAYQMVHNETCTYVELPVEVYFVSYDGNGAVSIEMPDDVFVAGKESKLRSSGAYTALGYNFAGWSTDGSNTKAYDDEEVGTDFIDVNKTLSLTAIWEEDQDGVTVESYEELSDALVIASKQKPNLPVTIGFSSSVQIPVEETTLPKIPDPVKSAYKGLKFVASEEEVANGYANLTLKDGVIWGDLFRGIVTTDALKIMKHANGGPVNGLKVSADTTYDIIMLLGSDKVSYSNEKIEEKKDANQFIEKAYTANPRPTTVQLFEVEAAKVTFKAMGGTIGKGIDPLGNAYEGGVEQVTYLCDTKYIFPEVNREGYTLEGWFDDWLPVANKIEEEQVIVDFNEQSLYAKWKSNAPEETKGALHFADVDDEEKPMTEIAERAYQNNKSLEVLTTPIYLEKIGQRAFYGCTAMKSLTLTATRYYDTLEPTTLDVGAMAFAGCTSLEELVIGGNVKLGEGAFHNCAAVKRIVFLGDEKLDIKPNNYAFNLVGTKNGTDELKVYMSKAFEENNPDLSAEFVNWNTGIKVIQKVDVKPVDGVGRIEEIDFSKLEANGRRAAVMVKTSTAGKPDVDEVDIEYSTDLVNPNWTKLTEGTVKTAYPDGTIMIEIVVPEGPSGYFRAVLNTQLDY